MLIKEILEIYEILDRPQIDINYLENLFKKFKAEFNYIVVNEKGKTKPPIGGGKTIFIKIRIKDKDKNKSTLGIVGQLGGIGARPDEIGFVSDGDGALIALVVALKLAKMKYLGEKVEGNFTISTHLCPNAPTLPRKPVSFMGSPVDLNTMNKINVEKEMDAIISIDTTRGNRIIKNNLFAITPIVKEGWILKIPNEIIDIMEWVTGESASVVPITMQDITSWRSGVYHINSILQPALVTKAPVMGIAVTSKKVVPGSAVGVTNLFQIDLVSKFILEIAKNFGKGRINFYDKDEFKKLKSIYGSMMKLYKKI